MCTARMTLREATQKWVGEFSRIPIGIVEKLLEANPDEVQEITPPACMTGWICMTESIAG